MQVSILPGARLAARMLLPPPAPDPAVPVPFAVVPGSRRRAGVWLPSASSFLPVLPFRGHVRADATRRRPGRAGGDIPGWCVCPRVCPRCLAQPAAAGASAQRSPGAFSAGGRYAAVCLAAGLGPAFIPAHPPGFRAGGMTSGQRPPVPCKHSPSPGVSGLFGFAGRDEPSQEPGLWLPVAVSDNWKSLLLP